MGLANHFRVVSKVITSDEELKELEHQISVRGGRITGAEPVKDGTRVYYSVPTVINNEGDDK